MKSHKDLDLWKGSMNLVLDIYRITKTFPKEETFGLSNQMRRAAVSIPSNIAEGSARKHTGEFIQFLHIAQGSLAELETQCLISEKLNYFTHETRRNLDSGMALIQSQISGLIRSVNRRKSG